MNSVLRIVLGCLLACTAVVYGSRWLGRPAVSTAESLAEVALHGESAERQETAAVNLSDIGPPAREQLRRVLRESREDRVRAACIQALGDLYDYDEMELLLKALEDDSAWVRTRANGAVSRLLGRDHGFLPQAAPKDRSDAIARMRRDWSTMRESELLRKFKEKLKQERGSP